MDNAQQHQNNQSNQGLVMNSRDKKKDKKYYGKLLVAIVLLAIFIQYYLYVFQIILKNKTASNQTLMYTILTFFHILIIMLLWSFFITMSTNPGEIPLYWGFYIGDDDYKRKRYCLICNAFKPERSHHCSICNVCVLNMDHHCPWVENCIGFYNRKFFMQLLFYVTIITFYIDFSAVYYMVDLLVKFLKMQVKYSEIIRSGIVLISYIANCVFSIIICMFFKFHLNLVLINSTTIESLDKEHKAENEKFNCGKYINWVQVFGSDILFWFLPIPCRAGAPEGDGLTWPTNETLKSNSAMEMNNKSNLDGTGTTALKGQKIELPNYGNFGTLDHTSNKYKSTGPYSP